MTSSAGRRFWCASRGLTIVAIAAGMLLAADPASSQKPIFPTSLSLFKERIRVVNMIPTSLSDEVGQDSEPNLAVNPADTTRIVGTAFTDNPTGSNTSAPIFVSSDSGLNWSINSIVPSGNGMTGDISVAFAQRGGRLYSGILRGGSGLRMLLLRSDDPFGAAMMTTLVDRSGSGVDQPWAEAKTTAVKKVDVDRPFFGNNDFNAAGGKTASIETSLDAGTAAPPAGLTTTRIESRTTAGQDMPAIRVSVHDDGTAYGIFYRWASGSTPNAVCDIIVVRDDSWPTGATKFQDLVDPDKNFGKRVVTGRTVPAFPASLGANRLVASNMSVAVDPTDSSRVWIAWADRVGATDYTLHVRLSTDRGVTWSSDLQTITNATNPALAVNSAGTVGFLYQQLVTVAKAQRWETHFKRRSKTGATFSDRLLANTPDNNPVPTFQPYIGDYTDVVSVGNVFYGIFSASNIPDNANFPLGVRYQRNANFTAHTLQGADGKSAVNASIDPFFFSVRPPLVVDFCFLNPKACVLTPKLDKGLISWTCTVIPCRVLDPIPKNCTVKWECPGCGPQGLCPPWHHITLEGIDPKIWEVSIFTHEGDDVKHIVRPTPNGVVLSFRPSERNYRPRDIGDFVLAFESSRVKPGQQVTVKARLETNDKPPLK